MYILLLTCSSSQHPVPAPWKADRFQLCFSAYLKLLHFSFFLGHGFAFFFTHSLQVNAKQIHTICQLTCRKHQETVMLYTFLGNAPSLNIKKQNALSYLKGSYSITFVYSGSVAANTCLISRERDSAMSFSFVMMTPISATENLTKRKARHRLERKALCMHWQELSRCRAMLNF